MISQVLAIPPRRRERAIVSYLTSEEADVLIAAPDRTTWLGRRDHALLLLAVQTGLRVSELTGLTGLLARDAGYAAIRQLPSIGPALGAVIAAEIGDITRFRAPGQLASWAGLTPRHHESDAKVIRGHVSKQGSRMLRWAVTEAIQHQPAGTRPQQVKEAIIARRGAEARSIARTAAARQQLTLVFYAMRDGHVRRATRPAA